MRKPYPKRPYRRVTSYRFVTERRCEAILECGHVVNRNARLVGGKGCNRRFQFRLAGVKCLACVVLAQRIASASADGPIRPSVMRAIERAVTEDLTLRSWWKDGVGLCGTSEVKT
jgi:hypothetical protein